MVKLRCKNPECETNKAKVCEACNGKGVNTRGQRCMDCNAEKSVFDDPDFNLHVVVITERDYALDEDGMILELRDEGDDWNQKYSNYIHCIKCQVCGEDIPIPDGWEGTGKEKMEAGRAYRLLDREWSLPDKLQREGGVQRPTHQQMGIEIEDAPEKDGV